MARSNNCPAITQAAAKRGGHREAILQSALVAFSRHGYDGIGVREIAQAAVTAVLVNRISAPRRTVRRRGRDRICRYQRAEGDSSLLAQRLTADVMTKSEKDAEPINPFFLVLRSAPNPRAAEYCGNSIARHFERTVEILAAGPQRVSERR